MPTVTSGVATPPEVWDNRWRAVQDRITSLKDQIKGGQNRLSELANLLARLEKFGNKQFKFFYDGFFVYPNNLELSPDFSIDCVLSTTLAQIGFDINVIEIGIHQRQSATPDERETLELGDRLARRALSFAEKSEWLPSDKPASALTYFQKSPSIRVVPYAPVALIGIPYTSVQVKRDLLAIPHEVGHYVYWAGRQKPNNHPLYRILLAAVPKSLSGWVLNWLEEIFADVYGCLAAGPISALSLQDIVNQNPSERFDKNDDEHPVPVLRPHIAIRALRDRANGNVNWKVIADHLDTRWKTRRKGIPNFILKSGHKTAITEAISTNIHPDPMLPVDRMIQESATLLSQSDDWLASLGVVDSNDSDLPEKLYQEFDVQKRKLTDGIDVPLITPEEDPWQKWVESEEFFKDNNHLPKYPMIAGEISELNNPQSGWLPIFSALGWTKEGPEGNWRP